MCCVTIVVSDDIDKQIKCQLWTNKVYWQHIKKNIYDDNRQEQIGQLGCRLTELIMIKVVLVVVGGVTTFQTNCTNISLRQLSPTVHVTQYVHVWRLWMWMWYTQTAAFHCFMNLSQ